MAILTGYPTTSVNLSGSVFGDGRKTCTLAGTREQFSNQQCKYVIITGLEGNTDMVVIGGATVVASASTRSGIPLTALQQIRFDVNNTNLLYIDSVVSGEGVSYIYVN